jgi:hypothetical protein
LPEDEQTSKHGGGGRYNAILEFKGEQIKNEKEKKKMSIKKKKEKEKNMSMCKNKISELPGSLKCIRNFKASRLKDPCSFPTMCNPIMRTSFVPRDHSLPFAHVHLSQVCVFFSPPH